MSNVDLSFIEIWDLLILMVMIVSLICIAYFFRKR